MKESIDKCFRLFSKDIMKDFCEYGMIIEGPYGFSQGMIRETDYLEEKVNQYLESSGQSANCTLLGDFSGEYFSKHEPNYPDYFSFVTVMNDEDRSEYIEKAKVLREKYLIKFKPS